MHADHVLPLYLVCDLSFSMENDLDELNESLRAVHRTLVADPETARTTCVSVIGFSGSAEVLLPLSRLAEISELPVLEPGSATNFGPAFALLRSTIPDDLEKLPTSRRPVVLFLSDGQPSDPASWQSSYAELTELPWSKRPHVVAYGLGEAEPLTLRRIGTAGVVLPRETTCHHATLLTLIKTLPTSEGGMTWRSTERPSP